MSVIKEFNYSNNSQRKWLYYNIFLSFSIVSYIFAESILSLKEYFFYINISQIILISIIVSAFIGSILGRLLFTFFKNSRMLFVLVDSFFIASSLLFLLRGYVFSELKEPLFSLYQANPLYLTIAIGFIFFWFGIKINYFLKLSSGHFIDEKLALKKNIVSILLGLTLGLILKLFSHWGIYTNIVFAILIIPSVLLIKLKFNPNSLLAKQFVDENYTEKEKIHKRNDLMFTYLNFSFIIIYIYLSYEIISKYYGNIQELTIIYPAIISLFLFLGIMIGTAVKKAFWHIYSEMLFPLFVIGFVLFLSIFHSYFKFQYAMFFLIPVILLFGFSLQHTIQNIIDHFNQKERFNILFFSIFILPAPLIIGMSSITFTFLIFFVFLYILTFANLLIPGIHLVSRKIDGYKKILFFVVALTFIPSIFFIHIFFEIPLQNKLFKTNIKNFYELTNINYNANIIKQKATIYLKDQVIFKASDSIIKNLKQSIVPLSLYINKNETSSNILFIDGNQRFYRNPFFILYENFSVLDILTDEIIDNQKLPISGNQNYIPERDELLQYLRLSKKNYNIIMDIPNLLDQKKNVFRYSKSYYAIIKNKLSQDGIFVQLYNILEVDKSIFKKSLKNLKDSFKERKVFLFSNTMIILNSNNSDVLNLNHKKINNLKLFINNNDKISNLFYNEYQLLSHQVDMNLENISFSDDFFSNYFVTNNVFTKNLDTKNPFTKNTIRKISKDDKILTLLKRIEKSQSDEKYIDETEYLFEVNKYSGYRPKLKNYLSKILEHKKDFYLKKAIHLEQEKKWKRAKKLYKAILTIDKKNFEANYRLGILSLSLQEMDNAYRYLQYALKLKTNDTKVLFQLGILSLTNDENEKAIKSFEKIISKKKYSSELYLYLGIANERLKKLEISKNYYNKALLLDQNDINITDSIERIEKKIEYKKNIWKSKDRKNQLDEEIDEAIPLPINKSAYKIRLENEKPNK